MRKHALSVAIAALVCVLLLAAVALAQPGGPDPAPWYVVEKGAASGGHYHLTSLAWQVEGAAGGEGYRLLSPASPTLRGNGCCCTYLPCLLRNY
ncbi:MAG: hypothetical protein ACE5OS_08975 [Anaerolineae bacterium]